LARLNNQDLRETAELWLALATLTVGKRSIEAARQARAAADRLGMTALANRASFREGVALQMTGDARGAYEVLAPLRNAFEAADDASAVAGCSMILGMVTLEQGDEDASEHHYREALRRYRALGDERNVAAALGNLGELMEYRGDLGAAQRLAEEALSRYRALNHRAGMAGALAHIARCKLTVEPAPAARSAVHAAVRAAHDAQHAIYTALSIKLAAQLAHFDGTSDVAARLCGYVNALQRETGMPVGHTLIDSEAGPLERVLRDVLGEDTFEALAEEGADWSEARAVEEALKA
jgi:tetratricopeptide (TPR) repeat protein